MIGIAITFSSHSTHRFYTPSPQNITADRILGYCFRRIAARPSAAGSTLTRGTAGSSSKKARWGFLCSFSLSVLHSNTFLNLCSRNIIIQGAVVLKLINWSKRKKALRENVGVTQFLHGVPHALLHDTPILLDIRNSCYKFVDFVGMEILVDLDGFVVLSQPCFV